MAGEQATIYDIAHEAGVSIATVSRVLSGSKGVSAKTKERVTEVMTRRNYRPSSIARGLYHQKTRLLGIVIPSVGHPYYAELFDAATKEAARSGYALVTYYTPLGAGIPDGLVDRLIEQRLDGALLVGGIVEGAPSEGVVRELSRLQSAMPIVTICPPIEGLHCITISSDLSSSVRLSLSHLYGLGHRRIAFLGGSHEVRSSGERERSFLCEMARLGLSVVSEYRHEAGYTPEDGELGVLKLLSRLPKEQWPTALIAINDLVALGALRQLRRMGLRVPEDMALVGCDNQFFTPYTDPPLTTVDLHPADHGRSAIQELIGAQGGEPIVFSQIREASLVVRESCGARLGPRTLD